MGTTPITPLPPLPATPVGSTGELLTGLWAGSLAVDPLRHGPRPGRARRWAYAAVAGAEVAAGVAVVDVGVAGTAFVWVATGHACRTWERRFLAGRGYRVGATPAHGAVARSGRDVVVLDGRGGFRVDVETAAGALRADLRVKGGSTPAVLVTRTPGGGWNVTQKQAGDPASGWVEIVGERVAVTGAGWSDWTAGRQDRRTSWRWAAGVGSAAGGRRLGLNLSTGMNAAGAGENVIWWDGRPYGLGLDHLEPVDGPAGPWRLDGPGWRLSFAAEAVRAKDEWLVVVRSRYVQPVGAFTGTVPDPNGAPVGVTLRGVTEHHEAVW